MIFGYGDRGIYKSKCKRNDKKKRRETKTKNLINRKATFHEFLL